MILPISASVYREQGGKAAEAVYAIINGRALSLANVRLTRLVKHALSRSVASLGKFSG